MLSGRVVRCRANSLGLQMPTDGGSGDSGEGKGEEWIQVTTKRSRHHASLKQPN